MVTGKTVTNAKLVRVQNDITLLKGFDVGDLMIRQGKIPATFVSGMTVGNHFVTGSSSLLDPPLIAVDAVEIGIDDAAESFVGVIGPQDFSIPVLFTPSHMVVKMPEALSSAGFSRLMTGMFWAFQYVENMSDVFAYENDHHIIVDYAKGVGHDIGGAKLPSLRNGMARLLQFFQPIKNMADIFAAGNTTNFFAGGVGGDGGGSSSNVVGREAITAKLEKLKGEIRRGVEIDPDFPELYENPEIVEMIDSTQEPEGLQFVFWLEGYPSIATFDTLSKLKGARAWTRHYRARPAIYQELIEFRLIVQLTLKKSYEMQLANPTAPENQQLLHDAEILEGFYRTSGEIIGALNKVVDFSSYQYPKISENKLLERLREIREVGSFEDVLSFLEERGRAGDRLYFRIEELFLGRWPGVRAGDPNFFEFLQRHGKVRVSLDDALNAIRARKAELELVRDQLVEIGRRLNKEHSIQLGGKKKWDYGRTGHPKEDLVRAHLADTLQTVNFIERELLVSTDKSLLGLDRLLLSRMNWERRRLENLTTYQRLLPHFNNWKFVTQAGISTISFYEFLKEMVAKRPMDPIREDEETISVLGDDADTISGLIDDLHLDQSERIRADIATERRLADFSDRVSDRLNDPILRETIPEMADELRMLQIEMRSFVEAVSRNFNDMQEALIVSLEKIEAEEDK